MEHQKNSGTPKTGRILTKVKKSSLVIGGSFIGYQTIKIIESKAFDSGFLLIFLALLATVLVVFFKLANDSKAVDNICTLVERVCVAARGIQNGIDKGSKKGTLVTDQTTQQKTN